jgi:hypothetical protein
LRPPPRSGISVARGAGLLLGGFVIGVSIVFFMTYLGGGSAPGTVATTSQSSSAPKTGTQTTTQRTSSAPAGQSAQVGVTSVDCSSASGDCVVGLSNTGDAAAQADGCSISGGAGVLSPDPASLPPGGSAQVTCSGVDMFGGSPGSAVTGSVTLSNGAKVTFSGTWR